jgi:LAS superfamily LD-carboxypeptidase LdcB
MRKYRETQAIAKVWVQKLGEDPEGDVGQLAAEVLKMVASQTAFDMGDEEESVDPKDIHFLARAIKDLESAGKISLDRELIIRRELAKEHARKLDSAMKDAKAAGEKGLSAERVAQLRRDFLGVRDGS